MLVGFFNSAHKKLDIRKMVLSFLTVFKNHIFVEILKTTL
jgi:hypothetical protein